MELDAADVRLPMVEDRFVFRFLSAADVDSHAQDPLNDLSPAFADRLECGRDLCFAALDGDVLAAYVWLALGSIEADQNRGRQPESGVAMSFGADTAFVYKAYTRPEYRGRSLYPACLGQALLALADRGVSKLLVTADWTNRPALEGCRKAGFRDLGLIWRFGWSPFLFIRAPRTSSSLGLRLGDRAQVEARNIDRRVTAARGEEVVTR
jgi:GNAT superfamily N-acetyltransferase